MGVQKEEWVEPRFLTRYPLGVWDGVNFGATNENYNFGYSNERIIIKKERRNTFYNKR